MYKPARPSLIATAAATSIAAYFFYFTGAGIVSGFSHDDLMNIYYAFRDGWVHALKGNVVFFSSAFRPLGQLFYLSFYNIYGLNPLPFRLACFLFLGLNIVLAYVFAKRLTGSRETGVLAALIHCFHVNMFSLYLGSGNCYDVFAFFFYFAAFVYYASIRSRGLEPNWRQLLLIAIIFIFGLNSKEIAVSLPATLFVYELVIASSRSWKAVAVTGVLGGLYVVGKLTGSGSLTSHPSYEPHFTLTAYLNSMAHYLNEVVYRVGAFSHSGAAAFLAALVAVAALLRSRPLLFCALFAAISPLPVAFIEPRGLASHYIPYLALAIYAAALLVRFRQLFRMPAPVIFAAVMIFLSTQHTGHNRRITGAYFEENRPIQMTAKAFTAHRDWFPHGREILIASDAFREHDWASSFLAFLAAHDMSISVTRLPNLNPKPDSTRIHQFATVIVFEDGQYRLADKRSLLDILQR